MILKHFLCEDWVEGKGQSVNLYNPSNGDIISEVRSGELDIAKALAYARDIGVKNLQNMDYMGRSDLLAATSDLLKENREEYYRIALENSGNTKSDAAVDIEGGIGTLKYYAGLGKKLGNKKYFIDPGMERLARDENFQAVHVSLPVKGVAVHINAFNFPSWGLWEKVAVSILSGVPVFAKPATATAMLSYQMVNDVIAANILPAGALSLICSGGRELTELLQPGDCVAFTGSAQTALKLYGHSNVISHNIRFNIEADSLNSTIMGPDLNMDSPEASYFINEIVKEMTVKAGQKCTAIRRIFVPYNQYEGVISTLKDKLETVVVGDPSNQDVQMGPLVSQQQLDSAWQGIDTLAKEARIVTGGNKEFDIVGIEDGKGYFVPPTLLTCDKPLEARSVHEVEVFGPVATVMPYHDENELFKLIARGGGSLAASVFTADNDFGLRTIDNISIHHGRILFVDEAVAESQTGHGIVMPQCVHGGPGRAGGGQELGGLRGLDFYHQRTAIQGNVKFLERV
jgi:3,4-dehydroadipyl-CoA semialdehyde dehydrogenase